jgi:hypothetical protein
MKKSFSVFLRKGRIYCLKDVVGTFLNLKEVASYAETTSFVDDDDGL